MWDCLWKGPSPWVACEHGSDELQASAKCSSVFTLLECFSPAVFHLAEPGKEGTAPWTQLLQQQRTGTMLVRRKREGCLQSWAPESSCFHKFLPPSQGGSQFILALQPWGWKSLRWPPQSSRDGGPAVQLPGASQGFLSRSWPWAHRSPND